MADLLALPYSPWSEKARWALDHHHVPYRFVEYVPMLGEPWLRLRLKRPIGKVSVPSLIDQDKSFGDSFAIARHADRVGSGATLFREGRLDDITAWNERSEVALAAGRTLLTNRMPHFPDALREAIPSFFPQSLQPVLKPVAAVGVEFIRWKYGAGRDVGSATATVTASLESLRAGLGGRPYLDDEFGYADIAMAVALQFVKPVREPFVPIGPGTREAWTQSEIANDFADLLEWRDALYAKHRRD